jgi:hypothetical protein
MTKLSQQWPSLEDLDRLVSKSEGSFIWASTLVKFVDSGHPNDQLQAALNAHAGLDQLYRQVILAAPRREPFERVLSTIVLLRTPLSVEELGLLLSLPADKILDALVGLKSILLVPEKNDQVIQPFHSSLRDFLTDIDRSHQLGIDLAAHHAFILLDSLQLLRTHLSGYNNDRPAVVYACVSWCYHLSGILTYGGKKTLLNSQYRDCLVHYLNDIARRLIRPWIRKILRHGNIIEVERNLTSTYQELATVSCFVR